MVDFGVFLEMTSSSQVVTVVSSCDAGLQLEQVSQVSQSARQYSIIDDNCSSRTHDPGAICTIRFRFTPASIGEFNDAILIPSSDPDDSVVTVRVVGAEG